MSVKEGDTVEIEYTGKLEDGTVFDSTEKQGQPFQFTIGEQEILPAFEQELIGMSEGDEKDFELEPEKAYGDHNPDLIQEVSKDQLPDNVEPGMTLAAQTPDGRQIPAEIVEVADDKVSLDLNHPLAGKKLDFHVKVNEVSS